METQTETPEVEPAPAPGPLVRPQEGRWLAGVAAGTANRLGIPHWVARLLFFLAFASGGIGLFLYVAGWLLIPAEGEPDSLAQRLARRVQGTQAWFGIGLVILAAAILLNMLPFVDGGLLFPTILLVVGILLYRNELPRLFDGGGSMTTPPQPPDPGDGSGTPPVGHVAVATPPRPRRPSEPPSPLGRLTFGFALLANGILLVVDRLSPLVEANWRHYLALTLAALGVGLLVGTVWGRARWLIVVGLMLVPFMIGATVWEYTELRTRETLTPTSFAESPLMIDRGSGQLTIDLTQLPWNGETFEIDAELGAGEIQVLLPETVGIELNGEIGIGAIGGNFSSGGFGVDQSYVTEGTEGTVIASLEVGIGAINVWLSYDEGSPVPADSGDLLIDVSEESQLAEQYSTSDGAIDLDLSEMELTQDRYVQVQAFGGSISIILPDNISYRIRAHSDTGSIDLLGQVERDGGGTVRADNISSGDVVLELEIYASEGDITVITEGQRS